MSRSRGATSLTRRPPMWTSPVVIDSRPAIRRRVVLFPQPDGPTRTSSSPSPVSNETSDTAFTPFAYVLPTLSSLTFAMNAMPPSPDRPARAPVRSEPDTHRPVVSSRCEQTASRSILSSRCTAVWPVGARSTAAREAAHPATRRSNRLSRGHLAERLAAPSPIATPSARLRPRNSAAPGRVEPATT